MLDPELQGIVDSEIAALDAGLTASTVVGIFRSNHVELKAIIFNIVQIYTRLGGDKLKVRRGLQITVDQWIAEQLLDMDLPGPDKIIVPRIREAVVLFVGKVFDELTSG